MARTPAPTTVANVRGDSTKGTILPTCIDKIYHAADPAGLPDHPAGFPGPTRTPPVGLRLLLC